jgi:hypothetical protein
VGFLFVGYNGQCPLKMFDCKLVNVPAIAGHFCFGTFAAHKMVPGPPEFLTAGFLFQGSRQTCHYKKQEKHL